MSRVQRDTQGTFLKSCGCSGELQDSRGTACLPQLLSWREHGTRCFAGIHHGSWLIFQILPNSDAFLKNIGTHIS